MGGEVVAVGFLDANALRHSAADVLKVQVHSVQLDPPAIARWFKEDQVISGMSSVRKTAIGPMSPGVAPVAPHRVYWYDGVVDADDPEYGDQVERHRQVRLTAGLQLRTGKAKRRNGKLQQKGVDTLIVLDLVRLAQVRAYDRAVLIATDADLAEAVRVAQDYGASINVTVPDLGRVSDDLLAVADATFAWGDYVRDLVLVDGKRNPQRTPTFPDLLLRDGKPPPAPT